MRALEGIAIKRGLFLVEAEASGVDVNKLSDLVCVGSCSPEAFTKFRTIQFAISKAFDLVDHFIPAIGVMVLQPFYKKVFHAIRQTHNITRYRTGSRIL